jgi:hypothetical protein
MSPLHQIIILKFNTFQIVSLDGFIQKIQSIINTIEETPRAPTLRFELSQDAAVHNMNLLQYHGNDLQNYILANRGTFISFGSEFRKPSVLEPLLLHHPNWPRFQLLLEQGSQWPLEELQNEDRLAKK